MPFLGGSLLAIGGLFLSHACYSAHEYTHILSTAAPATSVGSTALNSSSAPIPALSPPTSVISLSNLPVDITVEVLFSLVLLTIGIVLSSESFKPIRWNEWAAHVEHGQHGAGSKYVRTPGDVASKSAQELGQQLYGGPTQEGFAYLENGRRMGFIDIRAKRKEFAEWVKKGGEREETR